MSRDNKVGITVAGSFLALVAVVVGTKLYKRDIPTPIVAAVEPPRPASPDGKNEPGIIPLVHNSVQPLPPVTEPKFPVAPSLPPVAPPPTGGEPAFPLPPPPAFGNLADPPAPGLSLPPVPDPVKLANDAQLRLQNEIDRGNASLTNGLDKVKNDFANQFAQLQEDAVTKAKNALSSGKDQGNALVDAAAKQAEKLKNALGEKANGLANGLPPLPDPSQLFAPGLADNKPPVAPPPPAPGQLPPPPFTDKKLDLPTVPAIPNPGGNPPSPPAIPPVAPQPNPNVSPPPVAIPGLPAIPSVPAPQPKFEFPPPQPKETPLIPIPPPVAPKPPIDVPSPVAPSPVTPSPVPLVAPPVTPKVEVPPVAPPVGPNPGVNPLSPSIPMPTPVPAINPGTAPPPPPFTPSGPTPLIPGPSANPGFSPSVPAPSAVPPPPPLQTPGFTPQIPGPSNVGNSFATTSNPGAVRTTPANRYVLQGNENYALISVRSYGSDRYAQALEQYNRDLPGAPANLRSLPAQLAPGTTVWVPPPEMLQERYAGLLGPATAPIPQRPLGADVTLGAPPTVRPATPPTPPVESNVVSYRVPMAGLTVAQVAERQLGNPLRWIDIYRLNPTIDPSRPLPEGAEIRLPTR